MTEGHDAATKHIHFLTEVNDLGAGYKCERCGHATITKGEMFEHRQGIINGCLRKRLKERVSKYV